MFSAIKSAVRIRVGVSEALNEMFSHRTVMSTPAKACVAGDFGDKVVLWAHYSLGLHSGVRIMNAWDARPEFFVADVERSLAFYIDQLGFTETNRYAEDGKVLVGGVHRDGCPLLLSCQWDEKNGHARYWIKLDVDAYQAFRRELEGKSVSIKDGFWGFDTMIVEDPDGNELFFPAPKPETAGA